MVKTNLTEYGLSVANAERRQKRIGLLIYIGLAACAFAAYEPVRHNGFVEYYDDNTYVTKNPHVNGVMTFDSVVWAFTELHAGNWHPLTWLSHMLDCEVYGLNPLGHHITSLLIHIANCMLLFFVLRKATGALWQSVLVAALFALHPLQVDSVAWVAERKTVLSGLLWLVTIAAYLRYVEQSTAGRYLLVVLAYALCIMAKPVVVTLPLALLLLDYWPLGRVKNVGLSKSNPKETGRQKLSAGRLVIEKIPLLVLSAILCVITFVAQQRGGAVIALEEIPLNYRIANTFVSYIKYIEKMLWPNGLAVLYPVHIEDISPAIVVPCVAIFLLVSALCIYTGRRKKYLAVGWLWYVGTLVPVIGLVQVGGQSMANRYMYLPMIGLLIIIVWGISDLAAAWRHRGKFLVLSAAVVLVALVVITRVQVSRWRDGITLFEYTLKVTKNNSVIELCYGCALAKAGQTDEGLLHVSEAVRISPNFSEARTKLGIVYLRQGKFNEAVECFNELLRRRKDSAETDYNLAYVLTMQQKYDEAIKYYIEAMRKDPAYAEFCNRMGASFLATGKWQEAIACFKGILGSGRSRADVYASLGVAYSQEGRYGLAIDSWTKAAQLEPNSSMVLNNLAWVLATADDPNVRDVTRALALAQRSCELTFYNGAEALDTLAAAYAAAGKFPDAVATAEKALNAAKTVGREDLAREIQNRLELYRAARPYRGE